MSPRKRCAGPQVPSLSFIFALDFIKVKLNLKNFQVRQHLLGLGYSNVPDDILEDFANEFISRLAFSSAVRQLDEYEEKDLDHSHPPLSARSASDMNAGRARREARAVQQRGTRLSGKPCAQGSESSNPYHSEIQNPTQAWGLGYPGAENAQEVQDHAPATHEESLSQTKSAKKVPSIASTRSSTSFIRPQSQAGRPKRSDPVAKYQQFKQASLAPNHVSNPPIHPPTRIVTSSLCVSLLMIAMVADVERSTYSHRPSQATHTTSPEYAQPAGQARLEIFASS